MDNKWLIFTLFLWVVGMLLGATFDKVDIGAFSPADTGMNTTLNYLMNIKNASYTTTSAGEYSFVGLNSKYFTTLWQVMTFDFGFFNGDMEIIRWIILIPISFGIGFALFQLFVGIIQGLFSAIFP